MEALQENTLTAPKHKAHASGSVEHAQLCPQKRVKTDDDLGSSAVKQARHLHLISVNVGARGTLHVWHPCDVITMQSQYHVMGTSVGCFAKIPLQDIFSSLPVRLTPAEAAYLRDIGVARFLDESVLLEAPTNEEKEVHQRAKVKQYNDQVKIHEEKRRETIDGKRSEIFAGKIMKMRTEAAKKGVELPADEEDLWKMMREELLNRPITREGSARMELPLRSWRTGMGLTTLPEYKFTYPNTQAERVYYAAYFALMEAGFWITSGTKYGGDLLLYEGDVHINHSVCIVKITEEDEKIPLEDVLRIGRVATSCHKAVLWASVSKDFAVEFICSKWALMK